MKKFKFITTIIFTIALIILLVSTSFAGYDVESNVRTTSTEKVEEMYNKIIHFTQGTTLTNTQNENYIIVTNFDGVKDNATENSVVLLDTDTIENVDFEWIESILQNTNIVIMIEYQDLKEEINNENSVIDKTLLVDTYENNYEKIETFKGNGYYKVSVESNKLVYGNCLIKATDATKVLKNINMSLGKTYTGEIIDEKITTVTEESDMTRTAVNHPLRFYWSSRTDINKIYESVNKNGNILVNLYKGEVVYELGGEYVQRWTDEYGTIWTYYFTKVHGLTNTGTYTTGYMITDGSSYHTDGDGFWSDQYGFTMSKPLWRLISLDSDGTNIYTRTQNGVTYYGTKIKTSSSLFDGAGSHLRFLSVGNWVWVTAEQNVCGANNHHYMTIKGYSDSMTSEINVCSSTTFVDAGFNTNNPANYRISTRWW